MVKLKLKPKEVKKNIRLHTALPLGELEVLGVLEVTPMSFQLLGALEALEVLEVTRMLEEEG